MKRIMKAFATLAVCVLLAGNALLAQQKPATLVAAAPIAAAAPASAPAAGAAKAPMSMLEMEERLGVLEESLQAYQEQVERLRAEMKELKARAEVSNRDVIARENAEPSTVAAAIVPLPTAAASMAASPVTAPLMSPQAAESATPASPLQFHLGSAYFTPVGFMDMTSITRSTNAGSGIGTNFGGIPYGNTAATNLTESRLSIQNSRIGMRVDANVKGANVIGYWESDFLGQLGNPPNGGIAVSSNPYPLRLRLYWADVRKDKFELLGGQSWSMMTPNRKGISPLPGDIFFSQDIDVNYQAGLVWERVPGFRFLYHPSATATFGIALENSEPYVGGANGGGAIVPPAALSGLLGAQVNNGTSVITAAAVHPDIIAKLAFDPSSKFHIEFAGVEITNKIVNPASTPAFRASTKAGFGGSLNLNFDLMKNVRLLTNNFWSDGGGRYIFGQAPDFILHANGDMSMVHSASTVAGVEANLGKSFPTLLYGYYGGIYIQRNTAFDANGTTRIGYGFSGSSSGQNRTIQEITLGTNTTFWKDAKFGALNLMFQYSYLQRNPWFVAAGLPSDAHFHMGFVNLRYTLPGSAPTLK